MTYGISTASLYPMYTENALDEIVKNKVDYLEIFINTFSEMDRSYIKGLKQKLNTTKVIAIHPFTSEMESFLFFSKYNKRFEDGLKLYDKFFEICSILDAPYFIFHGGLSGYPIINEEYFEKYYKLLKHAKSKNVVCLHENVSRCRGGKLSFIKDMRKNLHDDANFVLDLKQSLRALECPFEMAKAMGNGVKHLHVSDNNKDRDCMLPLYGDFDFAKLYGILKQNEISTTSVIEVYRDSYETKEQLFSSYELFKSKKF